MFRRKLTALEYENAQNVDLTEPRNFRALVSWLEDRKIRNYKEQDRTGLRNIDAPDWEQHFLQYLDNLVCPVDPLGGDRNAVLDWLLGYAVRLEFADKRQEYNNENKTTTTTTTTAANAPVSENPLDKLDFQHADFVRGVNSLADALNIAPHPDHLLRLKACSRLMQDRLQGYVANGKTFPAPEGQPFPLQDTDLGFDTKDPVLNEAAKILRLLFVHDIRSLQTRVNEIIVAAQKVTANPKTDTRLGKVGS
ncbi:unnamed protein product [Notodromas monacha]|uniref:RNA transcription, translation and transport factor protein n=1 Tax=Notodromas monacha TaxID=399045 RepID=A0A7R9GGT5_9CRUS|nr:unnamed protein product [Notodromas monacha]CAG0920560.1 unnamed protein product [Notodromas monacha]